MDEEKEKEKLVNEVIGQIKNDLKDPANTHFVEMFLKLVDDRILNEYLDY